MFTNQSKSQRHCRIGSIAIACELAWTMALAYIPAVLSSPETPAKTTSAATSPSDAEAKVVAVLKPLLPKLRKSKVPVYLPAWLPPAKSMTTSGKAYPNALVESDNYSASLSGRPGAGGSATCFYMSGSTEPCQKSGKKVDLGAGRIGYIELGNLMSIAWAEGKHCYRLGLAGEEADLIKAAKSVIKVY